MTTQPRGLVWQRCPLPLDEYALVLTNPGELDDSRMQELREFRDDVKKSEGLGGRRGKKHFGDEAQKQIDRWLGNPADPLPSHAYKKLSDWFLTKKNGERETPLAYACNRLWNALFRAQPSERLTISGSRGYDAIVPERFKRWWKTQSAWQEF
jgi:hypothetical protein